MHPIVLAIAPQDRFQGLHAQVILASLVSPTPRIMNDIWMGNILTTRAQLEVHLFGRFAAWAQHPTPGAWIAALNAVHWEAGSATVSTTLDLAGVLREAGVIDRVREGTIYRSGCGVVGHWLWKPWKKGKSARDSGGYASSHADHLLNFEHIMANTLKSEVAVHVKDPLGNIVTPIP